MKTYKKCESKHVQVYLGAVFSNSVVVEASLGPELFLALLALQSVLELQTVSAKQRINGIYMKQKLMFALH